MLEVHTLAGVVKMLRPLESLLVLVPMATPGVYSRALLPRAIVGIMS